ncbi:hypothetical protein GCM10020367_06920 [Streptomyces sannanensis]|uniref:Nudix hydrolase domain-containing protein n=1 Tax=Streptomyces sannanensis TaxID=285536 RepID=A0ABP6S672_9ACTN
MNADHVPARPLRGAKAAGTVATRSSVRAARRGAGRATLWRHRNFRLYLTGQTASVAGTSVSQVALPLLAVVELDATTGQVALLAFVGQLPPLLVALHAGALAERLPKRRVMITGNLVSAAALASLLLAAALGSLTLGQLMAVAAVQVTAGVVQDAAAISLLPSLVDRSLIQRSNSRIGALFSVAATCGSHLGAALTGVLGAARALVADALSHVVSACCTARITATDSAHLTEPRCGGLLFAEIREGMRYVFADVTLRTLTLVNATTSFALALMNTLWALFLLRTLGMGSTSFGVVMGTGAAGAAVGALLAPRWSARFGPGPMMLAALALTPLAQVPLLLAAPGLRWQVAIAAGLALQMCCAGTAGTTQRSIRQCVTEAGMQARMQAVSTWLTAGCRPLAALIAGGLGTWLGVRPTLTIGAAALIVPFVVLYRSPVRALQRMPGTTPHSSDQGGDLMHQTEPMGTAALLINDRGAYLLHLRDNIPGICDPGTWSIPGGGPEGNETSFETIERELLEETGLTIPDLKPFTVVDCHSPDGTTKGRIQVYVGSWNGDADALPVSEGIMFCWFDAATVPYLTMCPWTQQVIDLHQAKVPSPRPLASSPLRGVGRTRLNVIGVHLYLEHQGKVLLGLRHPDAAFAGATHHFLAGHCEQESAVACLIREAEEEAGLVIAPADVEFVHAVHVLDAPGTQPRMQMVFRAHRWQGEPQLREPDKCISWDWWHPQQLPEPIVPYTRAAIHGIQAGRLYTELGWT